MEKEKSNFFRSMALLYDNSRKKKFSTKVVKFGFKWEKVFYIYGLILFTCLH